MKTNNYEIEKNTEKIKNKTNTGFITQNIYKEVIKKLNKKEYNTYSPYEESDKLILYTKEIPKIKLYKIDSPTTLTHQSILGSLFSLNITSETFGDIVLYNNYFYIYLTENISTLVYNELKTIGNTPIKLIEVPTTTLENYKRNYKEIELIVSSPRIDNIISKLIGINREKAKEQIKNKLITLNYNTLTKQDYTLKENDIFSIKKHGKYKYIGIIKTTKKDNYIIKLNKYI